MIKNDSRCASDDLSTRVIALAARIHAAGRDPQTAFARAEANVARLATRLSNRPVLIGDRLFDALAAIAFEADEIRERAWNHLAVLRRAVFVGDKANDTEYAQHMLREELRCLNVLAIRRRQALCDGGAAEKIYRRHMRRSILASWRSDDFWQQAKSREDEIWTEPNKAPGVVLAIEAALLHSRADAWGNIAKMHKALALDEKPDADTIADLRAYLAEIDGLQAMLSAVNPVVLAEKGISDKFS